MEEAEKDQPAQRQRLVIDRDGLQECASRAAGAPRRRSWRSVSRTDPSAQAVRVDGIAVANAGRHNFCVIQLR